MKILILSLETWKNDTNGGNVLSNLFENFDAEYAQIYCSAGMPQNNICKKYFQMTDAMAIKNIVKKENMGQEIIIDNFKINNELDIDNTINKIKNKGNFGFLRVFRQIVWALSNYKNERLKKFILDFNPDIIFAPCYGSTYMLSLTRYVAKLTNKPVISYISDDFYSFKQINLSPVFWINRLIIRKKVRQTWKYYSLIYTMTDTQKEVMSKLGKSIKILKKSGTFNKYNEKKKQEYPIKIVYAGGIYLNRWKTLVKIANILNKIDKSGNLLRLDIYTNNRVNKKTYDKLNTGNSHFHKSVEYSELKKIYKSSDIALHVESFDIRNRLSVRMSFSTKIIDCLDSECAVMAICDKKQGGFQYLKKEDAAICIDSLNKIENVFKNILNNPNILNEYRKKAYECGKRNHQKTINDKILQNDFERLANKK